MSEYVIYTDSGCDIPGEVIKGWGAKYCNFTFVFNDSEKIYTPDTLRAGEFYAKMRAGLVAKTSAISSGVFMEAFEEELKNGRNILYIGFTSTLSSTYSFGKVAADSLQDKYPERKIITLDSNCASGGFAMLVYLTTLKQKEGADIEEAAQYARDMRPNISHWFTVDDLVYLKRGGRVSSATVFVGGMLGIKPVMHLDDAGELTVVSKVRGRKTAINGVAEKFGATAVDPENGPVFISQAYCLADAEYLKKLLFEKYGAKNVEIYDHGSLTGAHTGPGTLAAFFVGTGR